MLEPHAAGGNVDTGFAVTFRDDGWVYLEDVGNDEVLARHRLGVNVDELVGIHAEVLVDWIGTTLRAVLHAAVRCPDCGNVGIDHAVDCDYRDDRGVHAGG